MHYNKFFFKQLKKPVNDVHSGIRELFYWNIDSIQYVNPNVQIVRFMDSNPIPFIRCWLDNGEDILFDCDSKSREEIMDQLIKILGKSSKDIENEKLKNLESEKENPAIFGFGKERFCMCEIEGQVPCGGKDIDIVILSLIHYFLIDFVIFKFLSKIIRCRRIAEEHAK